jgi:hypothetical protein
MALQWPEKEACIMQPSCKVCCSTHSIVMKTVMVSFLSLVIKPLLEKVSALRSWSEIEIIAPLLNFCEPGRSLLGPHSPAYQKTT